MRRKCRTLHLVELLLSGVGESAAEEERDDLGDGIMDVEPVLHEDRGLDDGSDGCGVGDEEDIPVHIRADDSLLFSLVKEPAEDDSDLLGAELLHHFPEMWMDSLEVGG